MHWTAPHLQRRLRELAEPGFHATQQRFFREPIRSLGVRTPQLRRLAMEAAREYRRAKVSLPEIWKVVERLWRGRWAEERGLAIEILSRFRARLGGEDWRRLDRWVGSLANWGETDGVCIYLLAPILEREPERIRELPAWTRSAHRFRRRAAAVALVPLAHRGHHLEEAFAICDRLAADRDDLVEKAIGWLLKEASRTQSGPVVEYLTKNHRRLSRTTLRYACEKLSSRLRRQVLMLR